MQAQAQSSSAGLDVIDVLVVDDDRDVRETMLQILQEEGFAIATAVHGEEALTLLRGGSVPRLILLDLVMPVMDGRELIGHLQKDTSLSSIPVVIISSSQNARKESTALGSAGYLAKPIDLHLLIESVRRWVTR